MSILENTKLENYSIDSNVIFNDTHRAYILKNIDIIKKIYAKEGDIYQVIREIKRITDGDVIIPVTYDSILFFIEHDMHQFKGHDVWGIE